MLINDKINKCTIYNKFFIDDLLSYNLIESQGVLTIEYSDSNKSVVNFSRLEAVVGNIIRSSFDEKKDKKDCWYPGIITLANSNTYSKNLIKGYAINFDNLGIENAMSFTPRFKNWTTSVPVVMETDWIINSPVIPFIPKHGILFWYKKNSKLAFKKIEDIPSEVPIVSRGEYSFVDEETKTTKYISPLCILKKINNDTLYIEEFPPGSDKNDIQSASGRVVVNKKDRIFSISQYINITSPKKENETEESYQERVKKFKDNILFREAVYNIRPFASLLDVDIFISDGETYSYAINDEEMGKNYSQNMATKSYLSVTQYKYYKEIYNLLTIDMVKELDSGIDPVYSRRMKKLAHVLSTFPALDRTTQSILLNPEIKKYINDVYLKNPIQSLTNEINAINTAIKYISPFFIDHSSSATPVSLGNNYIKSKTDLFNKLISKYTPHLNLNKEVAFTYKPGLDKGPHVKVNQDVSSKCQKDLAGTVVYNNFSAVVGSFHVNTVFSPDETNIICYERANQKETNTIPLWDIKKKTLASPKIEVSTGPDLKVPMAYYQIFNERGGYRWEMGETEYEITNSVWESEILEGDRPQVEWSRIGGPDCIRFSDRNSTKTPGDRYAISTEYYPTVYIKKPGKYTLRLKVSTSFGIVYDDLIIYAYDGGIYRDQDSSVAGTEPILALRSARIKEIKPSEGLVVLCPNIREFAIGRQGVFKPSYTDCTIYTRDIDRAGRSYKLEYFGTCFTIRSSEAHKRLLYQYASADDNTVVPRSQLTLVYKPENTSITLSRIILSRMMDHFSDCSQCESFFKNKIDNEGYIADKGSINIVNPKNNELITFSNPDFLSTNFSAVTSYGGYPSGILKTLNIDLPFHPVKYIQDNKLSNNLPPMNHINLDGPRDGSGKLQHICYMNNLNHELNFKFEKGYFDPFVGWRRDNIYKNKSSVLKYNPGKRKALIFRGQGFSKLENEFLDNRPSYRLYRSRITLNCNQDIVGDCPPPGQRNSEENVCPPETIIEYDRKEVDDYTKNNGYRILSDIKDPTQVRYNDEFGASVSLNADGYVNDYDQSYCNDQDVDAPLYNITYTLNQKGSYLPENTRSNFRFGRELTGATIQDLEVQLNFLNYANPKDLVVWLDVIPSASLNKTLYPPKGKPRDRYSIINFNKYINSPFGTEYVTIFSNILKTQNAALRQYLLSVFMMNENPKNPNDTSESSEEYDPLKPKSTIYRLYLLNQDNITSLDPNSSIKFSDHSHRYVYSSTNEINNDFNPLGCVGLQTNGVIHLLPTLSPDKLSEHDIKIFNDVVKTNNLQMITNRFGKFKNLPLFTDGDNVAGWGECAFTLNIAVVGESDFMESADLVSSSDYLSGIERLDVRNKSNILTNSLCSWDLILHLSDQANNFTKGDVFGEIDYISSNDSTQLASMTNGYNYYYDFKDAPYMVPFVNQNAPNNFIFGSTCVYNKESLNYPTVRPVQYNILPLIFIMPSFTLVGALVDIISIDSQLSEISRNIVSVFNEISRTRQVDIFNNNLYVPKYEKYPYGSAEKALINFSKDGYVWYKAEVPIFRYLNCPIVNRSRYTYIKLHRDSLRPLSIFNFSIVKKLEEIAEAGYYKHIYAPIEISLLSVLTADMLYNLKAQKEEEKKLLDEQISNSAKPTETQLKKVTELSQLISWYEQTIESVGEKIRPGDTLELHNQTNPEANGIYGTTSLSNTNASQIVVTKIQPPTVDYSAQFLQKNCMYDINLGIEFVEKQISENPEDGTISELVINGNRTIIIPSIRPYILFDKAEAVYTIKTSDEVISEYIANGEQEKADAIVKNIAAKQEELNSARANNASAAEIDKLEHELWNLQNYSFSNVIFNKGYLVKDKKYYTVFTLSSEIKGSRISKMPEYSNAALIFKSNRTTIDGKNIGFDIWSGVPETNLYSSIVSSTPTQMTSLYGEGSYGTGSPLVRPIALSSQETHNRPSNIQEFADCRKTDTKKSIIVTPYISGNKLIDIPMNDVFGYTYTEDDLAYFIDAQEQIIINKLEEEQAKRFETSFKDIRTYTLNNSLNYLMDIRSDSLIQLKSDIGELEIHNDISTYYSNHIWLQSEVDVLTARLDVLEASGNLERRVALACANSTNPDCKKNTIKSTNIQDLSIDDLIYYIDNTGEDPFICSTLKANQTVPAVCKQLLARDRLNALTIEKNHIYEYLNKGKAVLDKSQTSIYISNKIKYNAANTTFTTIPHIKFKTVTNADSSLTVEEEPNYWGYWLNIDPEQSCARDIMAGPKILLKVVQDCQAYSSVANTRPFVSIDLPQICNASVNSLYSTDVNGADVRFIQNGPEYTFISQPAQIKEQLVTFSKAPWPELEFVGNTTDLPVKVINPEDSYCIFTFRRTYWINMGGTTRDQLVFADETYLIPKNAPKIGPAPDGNVENKVKNIVNLSADETLFIKFKNTPRRIWGTDTAFDTYKPNELGQLTKTINRSGGPIYDNIMMWKCIDPATGQYRDPPAYYKWMNEMIFRSFFSSADRAEHRGNYTADTKNPGNMVPLEYDIFTHKEN